jgi:hypothetical protein
LQSTVVGVCPPPVVGSSTWSAGTQYCVKAPGATGRQTNSVEGLGALTFEVPSQTDVQAPGATG